MTKEEIKQILEEQLALDYDCSVEEIQSSNNIFRTWKRNEGARYIGDKDCMLKIAVYREKLLVMADDKILDWCKQTFENTTGTWLAEPESGMSRMKSRYSKVIIAFGRRCFLMSKHRICWQSVQWKTIRFLVWQV